MVRVMRAPEPGGAVDRTCPRCGGRAAVHGRVMRAIHDWGVTFVRCVRLRCCGRTFLAAPPGVTPRSRYSDRAVELARGLVAVGVSGRRCAELLGRAGVPVTANAVRAWAAGVRRAPVAAAVRVEVSATPAGAVAMELREGVWLSFWTRSPRRLVSALGAKKHYVTFGPSRYPGRLDAVRGRAGGGGGLGRERRPAGPERRPNHRRGVAARRGVREPRAPV